MPAKPVVLTYGVNNTQSWNEERHASDLGCGPEARLSRLCQHHGSTVKPKLCTPNISPAVPTNATDCPQSTYYKYYQAPSSRRPQSSRHHICITSWTSLPLMEWRHCLSTRENLLHTRRSRRPIHWIPQTREPVARPRLPSVYASFSPSAWQSTTAFAQEPRIRSPWTIFATSQASQDVVTKSFRALGGPS